MSHKITPLSDKLGVEVTGLDLRQAMNDEEKADVNRAFVDNVILVFRDQELSAQQFY
ncbi:MAG TPA: taurine dioxygenase, partial [Rhodospirillaceae bacterium]|nr:taurine dioxygenase [Rhodospirillaceae bacterium]